MKAIRDTFAVGDLVYPMVKCVKCGRMPTVKLGKYYVCEEHALLLARRKPFLEKLEVKKKPLTIEKKIEEIIRRPKLMREAYTKEWKRRPREKIIAKQVVAFYSKSIKDLLEGLRMERINEPALADSYERGETDGFNEAAKEINQKIDAIKKRVSKSPE